MLIHLILLWSEFWYFILQNLPLRFSFIYIQAAFVTKDSCRAFVLSAILIIGQAFFVSKQNNFHAQAVSKDNVFLLQFPTGIPSSVLTFCFHASIMNINSVRVSCQSYQPWLTHKAGLLVPALHARITWAVILATSRRDWRQDAVGTNNYGEFSDDKSIL